MIQRAVAGADADADAFIPTFADEQQLARSPPKSTFRLRVPVVDHRAAVRASSPIRRRGSAHAHCHIATHIFTRGTLPPDFGGDFDRRTLTDQTVYDDVVRRWTERTGRPTANSSAVSRDDPSEDQARVPTSARIAHPSHGRLRVWRMNQMTDRKSEIPLYAGIGPEASPSRKSN